MDWAVLSRILESQGVAIAIIAVVLWFFIFKLWPWYTSVYFPSQERSRQDMMAMLATMNNTQIEMKMQSIANGTRLEYLEEMMRKLHIMWSEHDTWERKTVKPVTRRTTKPKVAKAKAA